MGLSISNPSISVNSKLLVTKSNTAGEASLGSATVAGATGASSWGQISASLGSDSTVTRVAVRLATGAFSAAVFTTVDIGIGGAGSETVMTTIPVVPNISSSKLAFAALVIPQRLASGQRLAVRITDSTGAFSGINATIEVYGAPYANLEGN